MRNHKLLLFAIVVCMPLMLPAQTISEKKAELQKPSSDLDKASQQLLQQTNTDIADKRQELQDLYNQVEAMYDQGLTIDAYKDLLVKINQVRGEIRNLENAWRQGAATTAQGEDYALWHQPETTLEQLVIDYGSQDYVYLIPPELGSIKVSISSNLPIPRASWGELLSLILAENGVGIEQLNPYLKKLVPLENDLTGLRYITNQRKDLGLFPSDARVAYVLSPKASDVNRLYSFLQKFADKKRTEMQLLGRDIFIVGPVGTIQELLKLYDFAAKGYGDNDYRFVNLQKVTADEMINILSAIFQQGGAPATGKEGAVAPELQGLKMIQLTQDGKGLFLLGSQRELDKAEEIIKEVEGQMGELREKTVYRYQVKHSDAEELARTIEKVYALMVNAPLEEEAIEEKPQATTPIPYYANGTPVVNPGVVGPNPERFETEEIGRNNFIVDAKTGSILMVVETDVLPRLKDLIRQLDVPKKMVKIDVLLVEKRMTGRNQFGLDLLKVGSAASNTHATGLTFNDTNGSPGTAGILEFTLSRMKSAHLPPYDLVYTFLLTQTDIQINSAPSVTTVNQTKATIAIMDEISVNTGTVFINTAGGSTPQNSFARAQYGVTIYVTPTVHLAAEDPYGDGRNYITLKNDVTFDQVFPDANARPPVARRKVENEVRVADGETIILGGLRRKDTQDTKASIPFLGEIPGIGKLFSMTDLNDESTDMYIFITPTILEDSAEAMDQTRREELCKRPGDIPAVIRCLWEARYYERQCLFADGMKMLFGRPQDWCCPTYQGCGPRCR